MARKWLRNALASVFAMFAMGIVGTPTGSLVSAAYAREAVPADVAAALDTIPTARLPREAVTTLGLIGAGGPYPYERRRRVWQPRADPAKSEARLLP